MQRIVGAGHMGPSTAKADCFIYDKTTLPSLTNQPLGTDATPLWRVTGTGYYNAVAISHNDPD
jgi:hypothetical protein